MNSPELKILLKYHEQLAVLIRNNLEDIARFLHQKEIINREKYREVTDSKSGKTDDERAKIILRWLNDKVEEDTSHYLTFYNYLRLKKEYFKISAQMNEDESLLKRISKWYYWCIISLLCACSVIYWLLAHNCAG